MHTTGKKPDWEITQRTKWNFWQKLAFSTNGIFTPANLISLLGALLVIAGFWQFKDEVTASGILLIAAGRLADIADGYVAHKTGTKSPVGELIDTTTDKLSIAFGLLVIIVFNLLPVLFSAAILAQTLLNSTASLIGRYRGLIIHPNQYGKLATFLAWFTIISYLAYSLFKEDAALSAVSRVISAVSYIAFVFFVLLAVHSTASYINQLRIFKPGSKK